MGVRAIVWWELAMTMAMLLALETQLRIGPGGPGELLLLVGLPPVLLLAVWRGGGGIRGGALTLLAFWGIFAASLCLGVVAALVLAFPVDASLVIHDVIAYGLLTLLSLAFATLPEPGRSLLRVQWMIATIGAAMSAIQLANAYGFLSLPNVDPWYWDRMRGWSENPNQFALLSLLIGFCAVALLDRCDNPAQKALAALCAAVALGVGFAAKSNAYFMVIAAGLIVFMLLKGVRATIRGERLGIPVFGGLLALASAMGLLVTLASARLDLGSDIKTIAIDYSRKGDDASADTALRIELWRQAISTGFRAGGLGLGPGPHLAIPASLVAARKAEEEPKYVEHPTLGLAPNFEAHNTVLELFVQGGCLAVGAFLWLLALAAIRAWRAGMDGVIALLFATITFGSFHVVIRHPLVWFCLCLGALAEPAPRREAAGAPDARAAPGGAVPSFRSLKTGGAPA